EVAALDLHHGAPRSIPLQPGSFALEPLTIGVELKGEAAVVDHLDVLEALGTRTVAVRIGEEVPHRLRGGRDPALPTVLHRLVPLHVPGSIAETIVPHLRRSRIMRTGRAQATGRRDRRPTPIGTCGRSARIDPGEHVYVHSMRTRCVARPPLICCPSARSLRIGREYTRHPLSCRGVTRRMRCPC